MSSSICSFVLLPFIYATISVWIHIPRLNLRGPFPSLRSYSAFFSASHFCWGISLKPTSSWCSLQRNLRAWRFSSRVLRQAGTPSTFQPHRLLNSVLPSSLKPMSAMSSSICSFVLFPFLYATISLSTQFPRPNFRGPFPSPRSYSAFPSASFLMGISLKPTAFWCSLLRCLRAWRFSSRLAMVSFRTNEKEE